MCIRDRYQRRVHGKIMKVASISELKLKSMLEITLMKMIRCQSFFIDCQNGFYEQKNIPQLLEEKIIKENRKEDIAIIQSILAILCTFTKFPEINILDFIQKATDISLFKNNKLRPGEKREKRSCYYEHLSWLLCNIFFDDLSLIFVYIRNIFKEETKMQELLLNHMEVYQYAVKKSYMNKVLCSQYFKKVFNNIDPKEVPTYINSELRTPETEIIINKLFKKSKFREENELCQFTESAISFENIFNLSSFALLNNSEKNLYELKEISGNSGYNPLAMVGFGSPYKGFNSLLIESFLGSKKMLKTIRDLILSEVIYYKKPMFKFGLMMLMIKAFSPKHIKIYQKYSKELLLKAEAVVKEHPIFEGTINEFKKAISEDSEEKAKMDSLKKEALMRRMKVMEEFKKRQNQFGVTNVELLKKINEGKNDENEIICSICKKPLELKPGMEEDGAFGKSIIRTRNNAVLYGQMQVLKRKNLPTFITGTYYNEILLTKKKFRTCGHYMHTECFNDYVGQSIDDSTKLIFCPICKVVIKELLPCFSQINKKKRTSFWFFFCLIQKKKKKDS
eukprot:TRINITY_DN8861_c0_g1_i1.p1 TRINITY_DN8861_c0_g1~~TRINITY_DN8861_c0_g1_i1.p1  ORF type:complete len:564 (-),score=124.81 TRINITY_DN8861_c0_g1_i1:409-2100(-)